MTALLDDDLVFAARLPSSGTVRERAFTPKINVEDTSTLRRVSLLSSTLAVPSAS
jgi:hypothetical protein